MKAESHTENSGDQFNCLVIMDLVIAEDYMDRYGEFDRNPTRRNATHKILYRDLTGSGARIMIGGRELYARIYSFDKHRDCRFEDSFGAPIEEVDFSSMVERDVWAYIFGEYFMGAELSMELSGFGLIQL